QTLFAACELGVFDLLSQSKQPMRAAEIAHRLKTNVDGMERLLAACVGLELLHAEMIEGEELSRIYLTRSSPKSLFQSIQYNSQTIYLCWHYLTDAVRSEEEVLKFMQLMNSVWNICGRDVVTAFDLSNFEKICDLGGCSGALAKQCVLTYPEAMVTIFDLPRVVEMSKKHFVSVEENRISFQEGDFFRDPLPVADLYILARILHDWTDEKCVELLIKVNKACQPGGGVLLIEALLNEDKSGPLTVQLYSLNMLVQTEGRERSPTEYSRLLEAAGFKDIQVQRTGKLYDAILGRK
ncbi:ASMT methyltransferase, partial [Polypterus senegalus]|nr:ASMT methyltransferase [Polypterus senegalus]